MKKMFTLVLIAAAFAATSSFAQVGATIALTGTVLDEITRQPVTVTLTFYDESGKKANDTRSNDKEGGSYYAILKPGMKYRMEISHPNYFREDRIVETPKTNKYAEVSRDWVARPLREGVKLPLAVSPFEYKKPKFRFGAEDILDGLKSALVKNPGVRFEIQCFPDIDGNKDANMKLTQDRISTLKEFFVKAGVSADRITMKPSGDMDPMNPPPTKKGAKGKRYVGSTYIVVTKV